jgi:hypothetical protein
MMKKKKSQSFPSAQEDARAAEWCPESPQTLSPAYRLAYRDPDFLLRDELCPVRLQLKLLKPELVMNEHRVEDTVVIFVGRAFWERIIHFEALVEEGTISPEDIHLFRYVETVEEAWEIISENSGAS